MEFNNRAEFTTTVVKPKGEAVISRGICPACGSAKYWLTQRRYAVEAIHQIITIEACQKCKRHELNITIDKNVVYRLMVNEGNAS